MGHKHKGAMATTAIYAPDDPNYLTGATAAIDEIMKDLGTRLKVVDITDPQNSLMQVEKAAIRSNQKHPLSQSQRAELGELILARATKPRDLSLRYGVSLTAIYKHMNRLGVPRKK